jgi:hypothetical protein
MVSWSLNATLRGGPGWVHSSVRMNRPFWESLARESLPPMTLGLGVTGDTQIEVANQLNMQLACTIQRSLDNRQRQPPAVQAGYVR